MVKLGWGYVEGLGWGPQRRSGANPLGLPCLQLLAAGLLNLQRVGLLTEVSGHSGGPSISQALKPQSGGGLPESPPGYSVRIPMAPFSRTPPAFRLPFLL